MSFWEQAFELARVDLKVERRLGETVRIVAPFALVALAIFPLAVGPRLDLIAEIGPAVFWAIGVLFGMQIALRRSSSDDRERRDLHALLGVDPAARFAGRVLTGSLLTVAFLAVLLVAMILLFGPDLPMSAVPVLALAVLLVAIGLAELGTLAGDIAWGLRDRTALASLIVAPLAIPLVIGASQTLQAIATDTGILPWVLLMITVDLALAVAGVGLARPLEEATR
ncbi:MAG: heme exporter protein CcmB [Acidimicrobiia bacterium]